LNKLILHAIQVFIMMQFFFLSLGICAFLPILSAQSDDFLEELFPVENDGATLDSFDTNIPEPSDSIDVIPLWEASIASDTCLSPSNGLGKRAVKICPADRPDLEFEVRFKDETRDSPLYFQEQRPDICPEWQFDYRQLPVCDSSKDHHQLQRIMPNNFDLLYCTYCINTHLAFSLRHLLIF
jgi:hypothetical protein